MMVIGSIMADDTPGFFLKVVKNVPRVSFRYRVSYKAAVYFLIFILTFSAWQAKQLLHQAGWKKCSSPRTSVGLFRRLSQ